jgi:hypothetical protein
MKWFKHMAASADDEKLAALVGDGGEAGLALYGAYWRMAEIVALQMEGKSPSCSVTYPVWRWAQKLFTRKSHLCSILSRLKKEGLLVLEGDPKTDQSVTVRMPNLLKYRDEYSRKSGQAPESVAPEGDTEGEGDTEDINTTVLTDSSSSQNELDQREPKTPSGIPQKRPPKEPPEDPKEKAYRNGCLRVTAKPSAEIRSVTR